jgi:putative protease
MFAINAGADAVYIGAPLYGARTNATNSIEDIAELVKYAHLFKAQVFVVVNTILYDHELADCKKLIYQLYDIGVDALIVQDMAILEMDLRKVATELQVILMQHLEFIMFV